jgi:hypothetical protein
MFERLDEIERTYEDVERQLADPEVIADHIRLVELSRRHAELGEVVRAYRAWSARPTGGRCWTRRSPTLRPARPLSPSSCGGPSCPRTPTTTRT